MASRATTRAAERAARVERSIRAARRTRSPCRADGRASRVRGAAGDSDVHPACIIIIIIARGYFLPVCSFDRSRRF